MSEGRPGWLVVVGNQAGLRWVLGKNRLAFPHSRASRAARMRVGDPIVLYVTRGAFNNPTRDETQLGALGAVASPVRELESPLEVGGRELTHGCRVRFEVALPERCGVPFVPLVGRLRFIARKGVWSVYVRSSLVALPAADVRLLARAIRKAAKVQKS